MNISAKMIRPELRLAGLLLRAVLPRFTIGSFRMSNVILDTFGRGRAFTGAIAYRQQYLTRPDGTSLRVCVYTPKQPVSHVPGLLWIHGGGFALGIPEQDISFIKRFVLASGCVMVAPDYRRSMDAPFPAALDDCYQALLWLKENCEQYGVRSNQLFVGGDSAGGGLAAAVSLLARDRAEVSVAFQMPLYPMLDDRMTTQSAQGNDAPVWNSASNRLAWSLYLGAKESPDAVSKYSAPGRENDYHGLPATLTFVGSIEPFRDEAIKYVEDLRSAGVEIRFKQFDGCFHAFDTVCPGSSAAKQAVAFLMDGFNYAVEHYTCEQPDKPAKADD